MTIECQFCSTQFLRNNNLKRHYALNRCNLSNMNTPDKMYEFNDKIVELNNKILELNNKLSNQTAISTPTVNGNGNPVINTGNGNINIVNLNVTVNPITKLNTNYIEPSKMKKLVEEYTYPRLNYLLANYIKDIIHHTDHPENHSVKYIKKKPPTFSTTINKEGGEGETINVIKNLKDSCELLSEPVLRKLKLKLKQCTKEYQNDEDFQDMYEDTVENLYKELNKDSVKKALSNVLQTNIINDINMKVNVESPLETIKL